jgi:hypothetical protein
MAKRPVIHPKTKLRDARRVVDIMLEAQQGLDTAMEAFGAFSTGDTVSVSSPEEFSMLELFDSLDEDVNYYSKAEEILESAGLSADDQVTDSVADSIRDLVRDLKRDFEAALLARLADAGVSLSGDNHLDMRTDLTEAVDLAQEKHAALVAEAIFAMQAIEKQAIREYNEEMSRWPRASQIVASSPTAEEDEFAAAAALLRRRRR